ncbi:HNH endonuclease [Streptomyces phage Eddasa]|uniref:HNH endonuclease n=1 Tax=Streptomyces phage Eddasa TaxID=2182318 RepID=A0A2U8UTQ3_9CAUD|nr:HNH endonuclease [Streptomyces phage Eddasa]
MSRVPCEGVADPKCVERFQAKVAGPDKNGCRIWRGATSERKRGGPIGSFAGGPRGRGKGGARRLVNAHSFAWSVSNGEIPDGLVVRHKCDVSLCCEPTHLELGTVADNNQDMLERYANERGEGRGNAVLTHQQAAEVHRLVTTGELTGRAVARQFNISESLVSAIKHGRLRNYSVRRRAA